MFSVEDISCSVLQKESISTEQIIKLNFCWSQYHVYINFSKNRKSFRPRNKNETKIMNRVLLLSKTFVIKEWA